MCENSTVNNIVFASQYTVLYIVLFHGIVFGIRKKIFEKPGPGSSLPVLFRPFPFAGIFYAGSHRSRNFMRDLHKFSECRDPAL